MPRQDIFFHPHRIVTYRIRIETAIKKIIQNKIFGNGTVEAKHKKKISHRSIHCNEI